MTDVHGGNESAADEPVPEPTIVLPPLPAPVDQLWHVLLDLGEQVSIDWTLVGGQMVLLHALEHGQVPRRSARTVM